MDVQKIIVNTSWIALIPTALINVPVVGRAFLLAAYPVFMLFPEMKKTGDDVTYVFLTTLLTSPKSWLVYYSYYFMLFFCLSVCLIAVVNFARKCFK